MVNTLFLLVFIVVGNRKPICLANDRHSVYTRSVELRYPDGIKVEAIRDDAVVVYWTPVRNHSGIEGYEVKYSKTENNETVDWPSKSARPASVDHVIIDGLINNVQYGFRIAILTKRGALSAYSPMLTTKVDPVNVVTNLSAFLITKNFVAFKWSFSRTPAKFAITYFGQKNYRTHYGTYKETSEGPFTDYTTDLNFTFPHLRPNTNCTFRVAVVENEEYYWPVSIQVSTKQETPPFVPKPEIVTDEISSNGVPLILEPASEEYGSIVEYWVVVVPRYAFLENSDHFTIEELLENSIAIVSELTETTSWAYVAATFSELAPRTTFLLGTGTVVGKYVNRQLRDLTEYRVFLRAFINESKTDSEKHYASSRYSSEFHLKADGGTVQLRERHYAEEDGVLWIAIPAVVIVVIPTMVGAICIWLIQRNNKQPLHKVARVATKLSLSSQNHMEDSNFVINNDENGNGQSDMPTGEITSNWLALKCDRVLKETE